MTIYIDDSDAGATGNGNNLTLGPKSDEYVQKWQNFVRGGFAPFPVSWNVRPTSRMFCSP